MVGNLSTLRSATWQAEIRLVVAERPEQHAIELAAVRFQELDERGRLRPVLSKPLFLVAVGRAAGEHDLAEVGEAVHRSRPSHREANDGQPAER